MICGSRGREIKNNEKCCIRSLNKEDISVWDVLLFSSLSIFPLLYLIWYLDEKFVLNELVFIGSICFVYQYILAIFYKVVRHNKIDYIAFNFYCHQKESRSFKFHQKIAPICSRCFGIFIGHFVISLLRFNIYSIFIIIALAFPLLIDGMIQYFFNYESKNIIRFLTGLLFSVPSSYVFARALLIITNLFDTIIS